MNLFELKPHPYSQMFPADFKSGGFSELVASVKKLGRIRHKIVIFRNEILDGNRRLRACKIAKVEPKWLEFKGTDAEALEYVWDENYNRRDLNASQRAVAFAQYCSFLDQGKRPDNSGNVATLEEAADKADVSKRTMQDAKTVVQDGTETQVTAIKEGKASVAKTAAAIRAKPEAGAGDVDSLGVPVPEAAKTYWDRITEAKGIVASIQALKTLVKALRPDDPMWVEVNLNGALSDLSSVYNRFKASIPAHVCPYCQGRHPEKCTVCKGRGVVSNYMWKVAIPEEMKKLREGSHG